MTTTHDDDLRERPVDLADLRQVVLQLATAA
jgi:hypothetical protein